MAGHRLGALEGGWGTSPSLPMHLGLWISPTHLTLVFGISDLITWRWLVHRMHPLPSDLWVWQERALLSGRCGGADS